MGSDRPAKLLHPGDDAGPARALAGDGGSPVVPGCGICGGATVRDGLHHRRCAAGHRTRITIRGVAARGTTTWTISR